MALRGVESAVGGIQGVADLEGLPFPGEPRLDDGREERRRDIASPRPRQLLAFLRKS
jgi:hypothetical protein